MNNIIKRTPVSVNPVIKNDSEIRESLSGSWRFRLDPDDKGLTEKWFEKPSVFSEEIQVPGSWQGQGFGTADEDTLWDFRLTARVYKATYTGTGWYCKNFLPSDRWKNKRLWLNFGGAHPTAEVWLNGNKLGENHSPFVPFGFEITNDIKFGEDNYIIVRISETDRIMGLSYSWKGNWSGLYRDVEITATEKCYIDSFFVYPDVNSGTITFKLKIGRQENSSVAAEITYGKLGVVTNGEFVYSKQNSIKIDVINGYAEVMVMVDDPLLWSPDQPNLYRADIVLSCGGEIQDAASDRFGFVTLTAEDKHIKINGEPYYIRGTGDFVSCPETGCPDWDRDRWRKRLSALRAYGYNQVRCQSYVYGPEYYDVADELGLIIQSEMGMLGAWGGHSVWHTYPRPQPTAANYDAIKTQWDNVVIRDVNHPAATMYCMANEFHGLKRFKKIAWRCYNETKAMKPNCLIIWSDGGLDPEYPGDFVNNYISDTPLPLIQHEFQWWSSFPDVSLIDRYSKGALRNFSAEIAIKAASAHNTVHTLAQSARNSQIVQYIEAKCKMETLRRDNPKLAGVSHFNAMDIAASPQGIINEFYEKKYADADMWLRTNGDTVVMCSLCFNDRVYKSGDLLNVTFYVSDYSHPSLNAPYIQWELEISDQNVNSGTITYKHEPFITLEAGKIEFTAPDVGHPVQAVLRAVVKDDIRSFENEWPLWFYPCCSVITQDAAVYKSDETWLAKSNIPKVQNDFNNYEFIWAENLDEDLSEYIKAGGKAGLAAPDSITRGFDTHWSGINEGKYFFTPPANYPPYEDGHNGTILQNHPVFGDIPHGGFADLNFYRLMANPPLDLEPLELSAWDPMFRVIHRYPCCYSLGYITECKIGKGSLLICSLDLNQALPEASYMLKCIHEYVLSEEFMPENELSREAVEKLIRLTNI